MACALSLAVLHVFGVAVRGQHPNEGVECWGECGQVDGLCSSGFCGEEGSCCRKDWPGCGGRGCHGYHCCVTISDTTADEPSASENGNIEIDANGNFNDMYDELPHGNRILATVMLTKQNEGNEVTCIIYTGCCGHDTLTCIPANATKPKRGKIS